MSRTYPIDKLRNIGIMAHIDAGKTQDKEFVTYPTWRKYLVLSREIEQLRVRDKRAIFHIMRTTPNLTHDTFFPQYGFTTGEFSMWQVLSDQRKPRRSRA